jgi:hypothetical protein
MRLRLRRKAIAPRRLKQMPARTTEPAMQIEVRGAAGLSEIQRMSPADYAAMKQRIIREARMAQAAAIRGAFARLFAAVRPTPPTQLPYPEHGD